MPFKTKRFSNGATMREKCGVKRNHEIISFYRPRASEGEHGPN